jgi:Flp pilus assembly protein TadG
VVNSKTQCALKKRRRSSERGSVTGMFVVMAISVILMVALVVDGGRIMTNRRDTIDIAKEASRAAVQGVSEGSFATDGRVEIDPLDARSRADAFAAASDVRITSFAIVNDRVFITVARDVELPMLALLGVPRRTVSGRGSASANPGLESDK